MYNLFFIQIKWSYLPVQWQTQLMHIEYTEEFSFFLLLLLFSEDLATWDKFVWEAGTQSVHWWREQYQESIFQVYQCLLQKMYPEYSTNCSDPNFQEKPHYLPHQEVCIFQDVIRLDNLRAWETFLVMDLWRSPQNQCYCPLLQLPISMYFNQLLKATDINWIAFEVLNNILQV